MRPGDTSRRVDASTDPATILLEVCDENGVVQIWRGTSTVVGEDASENLVESGSRERTGEELAKAARSDSHAAATTEREAIQSMVSALTDIVEADTLTEAEQTEALKKLARICRLAVDMV